MSQSTNDAPQFIDIFAGAGGLSLGLMNAGWKGMFAIEKSPMAFATLHHNLIVNPRSQNFEWVHWLPQSPMSVEELIENYDAYLPSLKGIPLIAGGPPCQGFSFSGRRQISDERNRLFEVYLKLVSYLQPKMLLIENVRGFASPFKSNNLDDCHSQADEELFNASEELQQRLTTLKYKYFVRRSIMARDYGVPQLRPSTSPQR
jgi:DNA (cytosine-5)-methyltransferase 1